MAHITKGQLTALPEWRKHLRFLKRVFWKAERREAKRQAKIGDKRARLKNAFISTAMVGTTIEEHPDLMLF